MTYVSLMDILLRTLNQLFIIEEEQESGTLLSQEYGCHSPSGINVVHSV